MVTAKVDRLRREAKRLIDLLVNTYAEDDILAVSSSILLKLDMLREEKRKNENKSIFREK